MTGSQNLIQFHAGMLVTQSVYVQTMPNNRSNWGMIRFLSLELRNAFVSKHVHLYSGHVFEKDHRKYRKLFSSHLFQVQPSENYHLINILNPQYPQYPQYPQSKPSVCSTWLKPMLIPHNNYSYCQQLETYTACTALNLALQPRAYVRASAAGTSRA